MDPSDVSWQWVQDGPQLPFARAFAGFRGGIEAAWSSPEQGARVAQAFGDCAQALQAPLEAPEAAEAVARARAAYVEALRHALPPGPGRQGVEAAWQRYVQQLAAAFTLTDPATLRPADLLAVAHSIAWVAQLTADVEQA